VSAFRGPGASGDLEVRLKERGVPFRLRFVDEQGAPLTSFLVELDPPGWYVPWFKGQTDADGRIPWFDARPAMHRLVLPPGRFTFDSEIVPTGREQTVVVHRLARVAGRFVPAPPRKGFTVPLAEGRFLEIERGGTFTLRAVAGTCALWWAERGAPLASFDLSPGEVREDVEIPIPYK